MYGSQLRTILWLRWRLTRNQWARSGRLSVGISMVIVVLLLLVGLFGGIGGLVAGAFGLAKSSPVTMLALYDALAISFLVLWTVGILSTIQRSESIDIGKILHLPVSLRGVFLLNFLASHITLSIVVFVPAMLGLAMGLMLGRSWAMIAMVPLTLGFLFMITAWTYYLRGWLVIMMRNPRRYRAVVAGITLAFVLLAQLPNLLVPLGFSHKSRSLSEARKARLESPSAETPEPEGQPAIPPTVLLVHKLAPPLWVGYGAMSLAMGSPLPALLVTVAAFGIGGLGLARAYRSTCRFYEGRTAGRSTSTRVRRRERPAGAARGAFLERRLPGIPEEAAAVALASFRSLMRATEVKMALGSNVLMLIVFGGMTLSSRSHAISGRAQFFYATGAALLPFLGMIYLLTNQFGFDRTGFRTLVLIPAPRQQILLGKNLALLPVTAALGVLYLVLAGLTLHLGPIILVAGFVQLLAAFFLICILGNVFSSLTPVRVREGALAPTKVRPTTALLNLLSHMVCAAALSPLLLPALLAFLLFTEGGFAAGLVNLLVSVVELAVIRRSSPRVVTQDVE